MLVAEQILPFNRTIVELKRGEQYRFGTPFRTFNRTIVELKPSPSTTTSFTSPTFNRTIVELKPMSFILCVVTPICF